MNSKDLEEFCPANKEEWRNWLQENHLCKDKVWLIVYKKAAKRPNLSWSEAVDEALCFGWIDSIKKRIDEFKYKQQFGKRKAKSTWSKINKEKVEKLLKQNLISDEELTYYYRYNCGSYFCIMAWTKCTRQTHILKNRLLSIQYR